MSISSSIRKAGPYNGDGIATVFPFAFKVFQTSEVLVVQADAQGVETTLTLTINYTISLNVDQDATPGGSVNMLTAPPVGIAITLSSIVDAVQSLTLTNQGGFYPTVINDALDRITIVAQQIQEETQRKLGFSLSNSTNQDLPNELQRANKFLAFDTSGAPVVSDMSVGTIPSSIIPDLVTLRSSTVTDGEMVQLKHHTTAGDGGGGDFHGVTGAAPGAYTDNNGTVIVPTGGNGSAAWIRDYDDAVKVEWFGAVSAANATSAFNAAMAQAATDGTYVVEARGDYITDNLTFPVGITLKFNGTWRPTTTIIFPASITILGGGSAVSQFSAQKSKLTIVPPVGNIPTLKVTGTNDKYLENISITNPAGIGIQVGENATLGALLRLRNVHVRCNNAVATSAPLNIDNWFWLWIEDCSFVTVAGTSNYSMRFNADAAAIAYTGLIFVRNTVLSGYGVIIRSYSTAVCHNFTFKDTSLENALSDFFVVDASDVTRIANITFDETYLFDNTGGFNFINVPTSSIRNVSFKGDVNTFSINPVSKDIVGLNVDGFRGFPYTSVIKTAVPMSQEYINLFSDGVIDARSINADQASGVNVVPFDTLPMTDMSTWVPGAGQTWTGGKPAPDGSLTAYELAGAATSFKGFGHTLTSAVGDWVIFGIWVQETSGLKQPDMPYVDASANGAFFQRTGNSILTPANNMVATVGNTKWKFKILADKVTTTSGVPYELRLVMRINGGALYGTTRYWGATLINIPAGTFTDDEVLAFARSMRQLPGGVARGDVAVLDHQKLRLGGGVRLISATAAPTTGTWKKGDVVKNSAPAVGAPKGWVCTVAGAPGTWVSEGNL